MVWLSEKSHTYTHREKKGLDTNTTFESNDSIIIKWKIIPNDSAENVQLINDIHNVESAISSFYAIIASSFRSISYWSEN